MVQGRKRPSLVMGKIPPPPPPPYLSGVHCDLIQSDAEHRANTDKILGFPVRPQLDPPHELECIQRLSELYRLTKNDR